MVNPTSDAQFAGSIPELYDTHLVPMIFEPYAVDLAARVAAFQPSRLLETAAGTGAVTRAMAKVLSSDAEMTATDLNQPMLDRAAAHGPSRPIRWQQADAMQLPFDDGAFDAVVCQFGVMFFPDRIRALAEARRVLRPDGVLLFSVWDRIEENEFANAVTAALAELFPADPPRFIARTPHGYFDRETIARDIAAAGFGNEPDIEVLAARSRAASAQAAAFAYCQGTPLRNEIEARAPDGLQKATEVCTQALTERFGNGPIDGKIQALVVTVRS